MKVIPLNMKFVIWIYDTWIVISGLAPPNRVREGVVTESSIELLWDPAQGHAHGYEVVCLNCDHSHMVNQSKNVFLYV